MKDEHPPTHWLHSAQARGVRRGPRLPRPSCGCARAHTLLQGAQSGDTPRPRLGQEAPW